MIEVTVKVPEHISDIVSETGQALYLEALNEVAGKRLSHTRKHLEEMMNKIAGYELKHTGTFRRTYQTRQKLTTIGQNGPV